MTQDPDAGGQEGSGAEPGGGPGELQGQRLRLPSLKQWRVSRGLSQRDLAMKTDVSLNYVQRIEQGRRSCNPWVAQKIAAALEVDLEALRAGSAEGDTADSRDAGPGSGGEAPPLRLTSPRFLHRAYVKLILKREFGSAYSVLDETEFEGLIKHLPVEEVVEVLFKRRRELEFLEGLSAADEELHPQVHLFLGELVRERPDEDIRALVARRSRESTQGGRQRLTRAMRELL